MQRTFCIALLLFCAPLFAQQMKVYERGVIINIQKDTQSSFYEGTSNTVYFENYWVRVGDTVYKGWCRHTLIHTCNISFTIGDSVDVRFDKSSMFLKRSNGKEQKTTIEKDIKVTPGTRDALSEATDGLPSVPEQQSEPLPTGRAQNNGGKVTIHSVPENSEITIDNSFVGNSPATARLSAGSHTITARSNGFKIWTRQLTVLPDSDLSLNATLEKGTGTDSTLPTPSESDAPAGPQPAKVRNGSFDKLPKLWTFPNSDLTVKIEIKGDYLYEHEDMVLRDGRRRQEDCEAKNDGERWVGKCHEKIWALQGGESPQCSWDLDEVITSVSPLQITGESQESLPPGQSKVCPMPAKSMVKFVSVPKN
jgi:hypothetical protein